MLGRTDDDRALLRMLLVLRYEKDGETVAWLAQALAHHGNYAGLAALDGVMVQGGDTARLARAKQDELVALAATEAATAQELADLWTSEAAHGAFDHEPSDALRLAAWREIAELSSERFQLRGVDDARFALSRTGPWGVRLVAEALADADPYVRLHATQVLERMGARARPVISTLHPLLRDPRTAHAVAEALGAIGAPESSPLLRASLGKHRPHELRVAAARGLARLGDEAAAPDLRLLIEDATEPADLRLAAAAALLACANDLAAAALLADGMQDPSGDPQGCEVALEEWIRRSAQAGEEGFETLAEEWTDLAGPAPLLRRPEDTQARLRARSVTCAFLRPIPTLNGLPGGPALTRLSPGSDRTTRIGAYPGARGAARLGLPGPFQKVTAMEEIEKLFKTAIEEIERLLNTKTVVGEPIVIDGKTLIPLVSLGFGFGAGGGMGKGPKSKSDRNLEGLGGGTGGGGGIKPVGLVIVDENGVRFDPVRGGTTSVLEKAVEAFAASRSKKDEDDAD